MDFFALFLIIVVLLLIPTAYAGLIGAPYVPTFTPAVRRALRAVNLNSSDHLVDLGSGDGKILLAAQQCGARATGFELSPIMWLIARLRLWGKPKTAVRWSNFYRQALPPDTTVIFLFLMPDKMGRVYDYLRGQSLPQLRSVLVYSFPFTNLAPTQSFKEPNCGTIYIYEGGQFKH